MIILALETLGPVLRATHRFLARARWPVAVWFVVFATAACAIAEPDASDTDSAALRSPSAKAREMDRLFAAVNDFEQFSGGVLVAEKGEIVYRRTMGFSDRESGAAMLQDSVFELGSISKTFTAVIIHQLAEEGRLSLDDELSVFFPQLPYAGVTVGRMLDHTSGLFDVYEDPTLRGMFYDFYGRTDVPYSSPDYLAFLERYRPAPLAAPGERDHYSNTAYVLLGLIVEHVTNRRFGDVLQTRIFGPAGMQDTLIIEPDGADEDSPVIRGYRFDPVTGIEREPARDAGRIHGITYGDDELASTLDDLLAYDQALRQGRLLPAATLEDMWRAGQLNDGSTATYGSGFRVETKNGRRYVRHGGSTAGFWADLKFSAPDNDNTVIVFTNVRTTRSVIGAIQMAIDNILAGLPYEPPRQSVIFPLASSIAESGASAARRAFLELAGSGQYTVDMQHLTQLGARYEAIGQTDAASAVSRLTMEPDRVDR